jgi:hypothetical protein
MMLLSVSSTLSLVINQRRVYVLYLSLRASQGGRIQARKKSIFTFVCLLYFEPL